MSGKVSAHAQMTFDSMFDFYFGYWVVAPSRGCCTSVVETWSISLRVSAHIFTLTDSKLPPNTRWTAWKAMENWKICSLVVHAAPIWYPSPGRRQIFSPFDASSLRCCWRNCKMDQFWDIFRSLEGESKHFCVLCTFRRWRKWRTWKCSIFFFEMVEHHQKSMWSRVRCVVFQNEWESRMKMLKIGAQLEQSKFIVWTLPNIFGF